MTEQKQASIKKELERYQLSKVGFIMGASKRSKKDYFNMQKKHFADKKNPVDNGSLYLLNETQKMESGRYDAVIVYWSKFNPPTQKVVERIRNK